MREKFLFLTISIDSNRLFLVSCVNAPVKGRFSIFDFRESKLLIVLIYELYLLSSIEATAFKSTYAPSILSSLPLTITRPR